MAYRQNFHIKDNEKFDSTNYSKFVIMILKKEITGLFGKEWLI